MHMLESVVLADMTSIAYVHAFGHSARPPAAMCLQCNHSFCQSQLSGCSKQHATSRFVVMTQHFCTKPSATLDIVDDSVGQQAKGLCREQYNT